MSLVISRTKQIIALQCINHMKSHEHINHCDHLNEHSENSIADWNNGNYCNFKAPIKFHKGVEILTYANISRFLYAKRGRQYHMKQSSKAQARTTRNMRESNGEAAAGCSGSGIGRDYYITPSPRITTRKSRTDVSSTLFLQSPGGQRTNTFRACKRTHFSHCLT